jgi:DNA-directed RNA polymerase specialized sigma24 family protein
METSQHVFNFTTTRWTLVLQARGEGAEAHLALGELCQNYWQPVFRFLVREGRNQEAATDLTQEFFARLLESNSIAGVEAGKARFRSYLLGALKHFLANQRKREQRLKRGGGIQPESLDAVADDAQVLEVADPTALPSDAYFDRQWAMAIMDGALKALQRECIIAGKAKEFELLKPWLGGGPQALTQFEAATRLGMTEVATKVAVHRLRKRFRELLRKELSDTLPTPADVDEELRYLLEVLSQPGS